MKLSKNILILFGSYLGAIALVALVGRFTVSLGTGNTDAPSADLPVDGDVTLDTDIPVAVQPGTDTDSGSDTEGEGTDAGTERPDGGAETDKAETPTVYYVKTVKSEDGKTSGVIGVYSADGALLDLLSTPAFALPQSDRTLLDSGIEVIGDEALAAILEDFGG
ncbi:MAG: hypothetical protein IKC26_09735 [Clostridia bacterium]|nr:hypothetical protein [Clostridia bacterium]